MNKKGELIRLIGSLGRAEKRHFSLLAGAFARETIAARLFRAIEAGAAGDEDIRRQFAGERFLKQLHVAKNYLTNLVMRSLRLYHAERSTYSRLCDMLRDVEILYRRELYDHCEGVLGRAEKLATRYEEHAILLEIMRWKRRLVLAAESPLTAMDELRQIASRETHITRLLHRTSTLRLQSVSGRSGPGDPAPVVEPNDCPASLAGKTIYHHNRYVRFIIENRTSEAAGELQAAISAYRHAPHIVREDPAPLIAALGNLVGLYLRTGKSGDARAVIEQLRNLPDEFGIPESAPTSIRLTARSYNLDLELCRDAGDTAHGLELIGQAAAFLDAYGGAVSNDYRVMLFYQFAHINFLAHDMSGTMHWANRLITETPPDERPEIQFYARLLQLIAHTELGNLGVLKYAVASARRYVKRYRRNSRFERECLNFFARLGTTPPREMRQEFLGFVRRLEDMQLETAASRDYLDLGKWAAEGAKR